MRRTGPLLEVKMAITLVFNKDYGHLWTTMDQILVVRSLQPNYALLGPMSTSAVFYALLIVTPQVDASPRVTAYPAGCRRSHK